ncbi:hypothetical protein EDB80DRAFT_882945 [Ilyonectria destructans]|nr:hypothetical protein EDB80DRAFT_882945 [Ilyonectria destructans]
MIYCDDGSYFRNITVEALAEKHGTRMEFGPVSYPQSTGLLERTVRLVKNQLMKWAVERDGKSLEFWDEVLLYIPVTLNSRHIDSLGTSPAMAMYGFELFSKYPDICEVEDFHEKIKDLGRTPRDMNLSRLDALNELRSQLQDSNTARHAEISTSPRRVLRPGTWVWEKQDKANKLHGKFHKSWGNLSEIISAFSATIYLIRSLHRTVKKE